MELNEISTKSFPFIIPWRKYEDARVNDIYFYIGAIAVSLAALLSIVTLIRRCVKYYNQDQTIQQIIPTNRSVIIQRQSSIRNPLIPNHRSSLDIQFQMESRERRLLH